MNNTTNDPSSYSWTLLLPVNFIGILGNLLLIIAHIKDPLKLLKSSSSLFILNIAIVDLFISLVLLTVTVMLSPESYVVNSSAWDTSSGYLNDTIVFLLVLFYSMSFALYLSLGIQRFCSVAFPLWHRVNIRTRVCRYWVVGIWLVQIVLDVGINILIRVRVIFKIQSDLARVSVTWVMFFLTQCVYLHGFVCLNTETKHGTSKKTRYERRNRKGDQTSAQKRK